MSVSGRSVRTGLAPTLESKLLRVKVDRHCGCSVRLLGFCKLCDNAIGGVAGAGKPGRQRLVEL